MTGSERAAGAIYDIGYRGYDGPRLGRWAAVRAIYNAGVRTCFGLGRGGRSKIVPWGLTVLALAPALVSIATLALVGDVVQFVDYHDYLWQIGILLPLFLAAQAPELVVTDQRHQVLPLYFSRPILPSDYVLARVASMATALLALTVVPIVVLFVGRVLSGADLGVALGDEAPGLWQGVVNGVLHAVVLAALALAIACYAGRRAFAAGAVVAFFLITGATSTVLAQVAAGGELGWLASVIDPFAILDGTRQWLLGGVVTESPVANGDVPLPIFGLATLVLLALSALGLALRYRGVRT